MAYEPGQAAGRLTGTRAVAAKITRNGAHGWLAIAAVVAVWDVAAVVCGGESLSSAARRAIEHPRRRWKVTGGIGYLILHFYLNARWRRFDPLCVAAGRLEAGCVWARGRGGRTLPLHPAEPAGDVRP